MSVGRNDKGFTLIEIAVVIVIIAILATLGTLGVARFQTESLDAQRATNAKAISEALEKYYDKNGEYPPCSSITMPAPQVAQDVLEGISVDALKAPRGEDNSIKCQDLTDPEGEDFFAYVGSDTSSDCRGVSGAFCTTYELKYLQDKNKSVQSILSRREVSQSQNNAAGISAEPLSVSQINVEWDPVPGAFNYRLERSLSSSFSSPTVTTHSGTSTTVGGLSSGTTYYFRVIASRLADEIPSGVVSSATSSLSPPTGTITIAAAMSGSNARGTAGGGTCASGTIQREIRSQTNTGSWSSWVATSTNDVAATEGYRYTFQARARCVSGGNSSAYNTNSSTANVVRPVSTPSNLTVTATMSGNNARGTAGGSCATGTTIERQIRYQQTYTSTAGSWSGWTSGTTRDVAANQGWRYTFQQQSRCNGQYASSSWAASSSAHVVRPIAAPATTQTTANLANKRWTWSNPTCPTGTTPESRYRFYTHNTAGSWLGPTAATTITNSSANSQGMIYGLEKQTRCKTVHANGAWSGVSTRKTFTVPVIHRLVYASAMRMNSASRAEVRLKSYSFGGRSVGSTCASGTVGEVALQTSINDASWVFASSWVTANVNTQITTSSFSLPVDGKLEIATSSRCRNTTTGHSQQAGGAQYRSPGFNIGNMYRRSGQSYNINCVGHSTKWSWCAGGYNSSGSSTNSSYNSCALRKDGISPGSERWTPLRSYGSNPPCWNNDIPTSQLNSLPSNYLVD